MQLVPMRTHVEKHLGNVRAELRTLSSFRCTTDTIDRQKLLISVTQEYVRHLTDTVRGEYRDRIMVKHANLRLYTLVLKTFEDFQIKVNSTALPFKNPTFVHTLAEQIEQLRGRELPGFMSSQAFYMSMSQYVDAWSAPMQTMIASVRSIAHEVAGKLSDVLLQQYPSLRETIGLVASRVLNKAVEEATLKLNEILAREKDPFTMNDFLQQR
jgi:interferon-induced GTP-binding protein Mx1